LKKTIGYYEAIMVVLIFIIIFNIFLMVFSRGHLIEGTVEYKNNKYLFIPTFSKLYITDNKEFKDVKKGDDIYILYNSKDKTYEYSKFFIPFFFYLKGEVTKVNDYYIYIEFDFNNEIQEDSFYLKNIAVGDKITVNIKKFLGTYIIEEPFLDSLISYLKEEFKDNLKYNKED
jgi:hypothetical protein